MQSTPLTATYSLHDPHLPPVEDVCPKGLAQLLHQALVAIAGSNQNSGPAILIEREQANVDCDTNHIGN